MAKKAKKKAAKGRPEGSTLRGFVFTGDPRVAGTDPDSIGMYGYTFMLNGKAVKVSNETAAKLETHNHFTEK
jgi:hypothetical protein